MEKMSDSRYYEKSHFTANDFENVCIAVLKVSMKFRKKEILFDAKKIYDIYSGKHGIAYLKHAENSSDT